MGYKGPGLWAQYMYEKYRDKMWREQRTKFVFMIKDEDMTEMFRTVNSGFHSELIHYHMNKDELVQEKNEESSKPVLTKN